MISLAYDDDGDCIIEAFDNTIIVDPSSNSASERIAPVSNNYYMNSDITLLKLMQNTR